MFAATAARFFLGLPSTAVKFPPMYTRLFFTASERTTAPFPDTFGRHVRMGAPVLTLMAATLLTERLGRVVPDGLLLTSSKLPPMKRILPPAESAVAYTFPFVMYVLPGFSVRARAGETTRITCIVVTAAIMARTRTSPLTAVSETGFDLLLILSLPPPKSYEASQPQIIRLIAVRCVDHPVHFLSGVASDSQNAWPAAKLQAQRKTDNTQLSTTARGVACVRIQL